MFNTAEHRGSPRGSDKSLMSAFAPIGSQLPPTGCDAREEWTCKMNSMDLGNVPSGVCGYKHEKIQIKNIGNKAMTKISSASCFPERPVY